MDLNIFFTHNDLNVIYIFKYTSSRSVSSGLNEIWKKMCCRNAVFCIFLENTKKS